MIPQHYLFSDALSQGLSPYTDYRQNINFECPEGFALHRLYSRHNNRQEDRQWRFDCKQISGSALTSCSWTPTHNFDQPFIGGCSNGFAIAGFRSVAYSTGARDRQFSVECCKADIVTDDCSITNYINGWDSVMNYEAPSTHIISGIYSHHDNGRE